MAEPEDALRRACDALLSGDVFTAMADLTPEALNEAMALGTGVVQMPTPTGYEIVAHDENGGEHSFRVRFDTNLGPVHANAQWRQIGGFWKLTSIGVEERA